MTILDLKEEEIVAAIEILTMEYGGPPTIADIAKLIYPNTPLHTDKDGLTVPYYNKVRYMVHKLQDKGSHRVDNTKKGSFVYIVSEQDPETAPKEDVVEYENILEYAKKKNNPKVTNFCEEIAKVNNSPYLIRGSGDHIWYLYHIRKVAEGKLQPHPAKMASVPTVRYKDILFPGKEPKDITPVNISAMIGELRYEKLFKGGITNNALRSYLIRVMGYYDVMREYNMISYNPLRNHLGFKILLERLNINGPFVSITVLGHDKNKD